MEEQGAKLMATLAYVVKIIDAPDELMPAAAALAVRHVDYGVTPAHYGPVGAALLWMMEQGLGPAWDAAQRDVWTRAYAALSKAMIAAAYPPAPPLTAPR